MSIPSAPSTADLKAGLNIIGRNVRTYRFKMNANWNIKPLKPLTAFSNKDFKNISELTKALNEQKGLMDELKGLKKTADQVKTTTKTANESKTLWDKFLGKSGSKFGSAVDKAADAGGVVAKGGAALAKFAPILTAMAAVGITLVANIIQGWRTDINEKGLIKLGDDVSKVLGILNQYQQRIEANKTAINEQRLDNQRTRDRIYGLEKQNVGIGNGIDKAKKDANDALYEARKGREIVEGKITEAKKQSNDALYETRQNKQKLESQIKEQFQTFNQQISGINSKIAEFNRGLTDNFKSTVNSSIQKIQSDIAVTKAQVASIKMSASTPPIDVNAIIEKAKSAANQEISSLKNQIGALTNNINGLVGKIRGLEITVPTIANGISNLGANLYNVDAKADAALNEAKNKGFPDLSPMQRELDKKFNEFVQQNNKDLKIKDLQQSDLSKEFDRKIADFNRQNNLTSEQRFNEFVQQNNKDLKIKDLQQSDLSKEFDRKIADFNRQSNLTSEQRFEEFQKENKKSLGLIDNDLNKVKQETGNIKLDIGNVRTDIKKIDTKIKEQEKVNQEGNRKLDQILPAINALPAVFGRAIDNGLKDVPKANDIERITGTAMCKSMNGGCSGNKIDDAVNNINQQGMNNAGAILDAVNTGANAALLAGQQTILARLGAQLPGGIGGKLSRFADWMHLDRVLNLMIWATTIHNGLMLSNNLGQTLFSMISNVLSAVGLKNAEGEAFDIGSVISAGFENIIKSAVGAENYKTLSAAWKNANRIYQATANVLNSVQSIGASVLNALEVVGQWNAKVGNALKRFGVVSEKAYGWMNPNVDFSNKWFTAIENATNVISQIDQVASEVLSIKETVGQITEQKKDLDNSLKEVDSSKQKPNLPEAVKLAEKEKESKLASASLPLTESDKEPDEDN